MNTSNSTNPPENTASTTSTSSTSIEFDWTGYVRASLGLVGVLTNAINIGVFQSPKLKELSYSFMLGKSIGNFFYLAIAFTNEFLVNCLNCLQLLNFASAVYLVAINAFLLNMFSFFRTQLDLIIAFHTFCLLYNKRWTSKIPTSALFTLIIVIATAYNAYKIFMFWIYQVPDRDQVFIMYTDFGLSYLCKMLLVIQSFIKIVLTSLLFPVINLINLVLFRKRFENQLIPSGSIRLGSIISLNESTSPRVSTQSGSLFPFRRPNSTMIKNITRMVIVSSFVSIFTQMPYSVCYIISACGVKNPVFNFFNTLSAFLILVAPSADFFTYYFFNKLFKKVLYGLVA